MLLVAYQIVQNVGQSPHHGNREERKTEQCVMYDGNDQEVRDPDAFTIKVNGIGIGLRTCHTNKHGCWDVWRKPNCNRT